MLVLQIVEETMKVLWRKGDILPTLFTMPLTYCSESHAGNGDGGFSELVPSQNFPKALRKGRVSRHTSHHLSTANDSRSSKGYQITCCDSKS